MKINKISIPLSARRFRLFHFWDSDIIAWWIYALLFSLICGKPLTCQAQASNRLQPTNTIPVIHISTTGGQPIRDKEVYVDAKFYVTVPVDGRFSPVASEAEPAHLQIRGRGNASWNVVKKSYKIKLAEKNDLLGLSRHRHFALLACYGAAHEIGMFSYMAGLKIAELTGQAWVPRCQPVELVLNDEYLGIYLLIETIKVDKNRVNIVKQPDSCVDPQLISGGWLVEIDNYEDDNQVLIPEYFEDQTVEMKLTYKSPEDLSVLQRRWLIKEFSKINKALSLQSEINDCWTQFIDPVSAARYFITREMVHDIDGYNGSFYLHKDAGDNRWICGPMWDIYAISSKTDWATFDHPVYSLTHYFLYMIKTAEFKKVVKEEWNRFKANLDSLYSYIDSFIVYSEAEKSNGDLWGRNGNCENKIDIVKRYIKQNVEWIDENIDKINLAGQSKVNISVKGRLVELNGLANRLSIVNMAGKIIKSHDNIWKYDLSDVPRGIYILKAEIDGIGVVNIKVVLR